MWNTSTNCLLSAIHPLLATFRYEYNVALTVPTDMTQALIVLHRDSLFLVDMSDSRWLLYGSNPLVSLRHNRGLPHAELWNKKFADKVTVLIKPQKFKVTVSSLVLKIEVKVGEVSFLHVRRYRHQPNTGPRARSLAAFRNPGSRFPATVPEVRYRKLLRRRTLVLTIRSKPRYTSPDWQTSASAAVHPIRHPSRPAHECPPSSGP